MKVFKAGVKRTTGCLYFVDKKGNICEVKMARGGKGAKSKPKVLVKAGIVRKSGFLYYLDKQGDVSCVKMLRGRKKSTKKAAKKKKRK